jgi:hypothetical protein
MSARRTENRGRGLVMIVMRVIFDVDGVVLDSIPAYQEAWAA